MKRRTWLTAALAAGLAAPLSVAGQVADGRYRIGVLLVTSRAHPGADLLLKPFREGMQARGYIEGRNLQIEWREAEGRSERLPGLAAELAALAVQLIVAGAPDAAIAAKAATSTIPVVFVSSIDPVGQGLIDSLARSGNNVTGVAGFSDTVIGKQLELLKEISPSARRLAVVHGPFAASVRQLRKAGQEMGLQLRLHQVGTPAEIESALREIEDNRPDALVVLPHTSTFSLRRRIARFAAAQRLAAVYGMAQFVEAGGLLSYGTSYSENWRQSVYYVDRILKGAHPSDLPVQQPTNFELVVNLGTARALGVKIPPSILLRADRVIE